MKKLIAAAVLFTLSGACQCLEPVTECFGPRCGHDGGATDGGHDGGAPDAAVPDGGTPWSPGDCTVWDGGGGVGQCAAVTGYTFDGTICQGACVEHPIVTPGIYETVADCAHRCAMPYCHQDLLATTLPQVLDSGTYCDDVQVQTGLPWLVLEAFPELDAGCTAPTGPAFCTLLRAQVLGDAGILEMCAATLLPETTRVTCFLYGP